MIDINKEYKAFETEWKNLGGNFSCLFVGDDKMYHLKKDAPVLTTTEKELLLRSINTSLAMWLIQAREKQAEIDDLKAQLKAAHESRIEFVEYCRKVESGDFVIVDKTDLELAIDALKDASNNDDDSFAHRAKDLEKALKNG